MKMKRLTDFHELSESGASDGGDDLFGIILAGGNGNRLRSFVRENYGTDLPKQFVTLTGNQTLIEKTTHRVGYLIPSERQIVVTDLKFRPSLNRYLRDFPAENIVFQPRNRETAPGILLPLATLLKKRPDCRIAIFPSDHYVLDEYRFMNSVKSASRVVRTVPSSILLLGVEPDGPETDYGWIEPGGLMISADHEEISPVGAFHEKPDRQTAREYLRKGYLWNTLIMVAKGATLWNIAMAALPDYQKPFERIFDAIGTATEEAVVSEEYEKMRPANISERVLQKVPARLLVMGLKKEIYWSDLGNEKRVMEVLRRIGQISDSDARNLGKVVGVN
jgi:mannose-1-phosphate guanylyltransferase